MPKTSKLKEQDYVVVLMPQWKHKLMQTVAWCLGLGKNIYIIALHKD